MRFAILKLQRRLLCKEFSALSVFIVTGFWLAPLVEANMEATYTRIGAVDGFLRKYGVLLTCLLMFLLVVFATYLVIEMTYGFAEFEQIIVSHLNGWISRFLEVF